MDWKNNNRRNNLGAARRRAGKTNRAKVVNIEDYRNRPSVPVTPPPIPGPPFPEAAARRSIPSAKDIRSLTLQQKQGLLLRLIVSVSITPTDLDQLLDAILRPADAEHR
jgi:hypothetical protein